MKYSQHPSNIRNFSKDHPDEPKSVVRYAARRFSNRGETTEDMLQVGTIGLIKAIDRYDVSRGSAFTTLAVPYIQGEIKRFFRAPPGRSACPGVCGNCASALPKPAKRSKRRGSKSLPPPNSLTTSASRRQR
ncbi:sigma factor [Streptomyces kronopolitis]|uniref:sigma factor n=1 Tax=Streptomyces kronopolitis TaxID=1612435 RepID=UPI003437A34F